MPRPSVLGLHERYPVVQYGKRRLIVGNTALTSHICIHARARSARNADFFHRAAAELNYQVLSEGESELKRAVELENLGEFYLHERGYLPRKRGNCIAQ